MPKPTIIISNWNTMIEGLEASPKEFFSQVEQAIAAKSVPNTKHSRIQWKEGGILSAKREYLRIKRYDHAFDICGAPFGNGFFISWWLGEIPSGFIAFLMSIPILGFLFEKFIKPATYYKIDTAMMFQSLIHSAVLEVVDDMTKAKGIKMLATDERKPKMKDFFQL